MPIDQEQASHLAAEGISVAHAESFLEVSKSLDCVILTRSPGVACLGPLLAEGYDAKGFHIKGKSCDWGPMAGFLCAEPLFNKAGKAGAVANAKAHHASLTKAFEDGKTSRLVALELSDEHARAVAARCGVKLVGDVCKGETVIPNTTLRLKWMLLRDAKAARWQVYHDATDLAAATRALFTDAEQLAALDAYRKAIDPLAGPIHPAHPGYRPLLALTNPHPPYGRPEDSYKNAVTGDFDLFAVWPREGRDAEFKVRVGGMQKAETKDQKDAQKTAIYAAEAGNAIGNVVGNISDGLYLVGGTLNSVMGKKTGHGLVNRIFHSDEGGRPGMDEVDSSVGFTPDGHVLFFTDNLPGFARFAVDCATAKPTRFVVFLNAGWLAPLKAAASDGAALAGCVTWQQSLAAAPPAPVPSKAK